MKNLLDTDMVIGYLAKEQAATRVVESLFATGVAISIVTYMEVYEGILGSPDPVAADAALEKILVTCPVLPITREAAQEAARVRLDLREKRKRVRPRALDLIVAATALVFDLTLVTRNLRDYSDIDNLRLLSIPVAL